MLEAPVGFQVDPPEHSLGYLLWQVSRRWRRTLIEALAPIDLSDTQFSMLAGIRTLTNSPGAAHNQAALAEHLSIDVMTVSQIVRRLEARGLVERTPNTNDTRAKVLSLTREGKRLLDDAFERYDGAQRAFFAESGGERLWRDLTRLNRKPEDAAASAESGLPPRTDSLDSRQTSDSDRRTRQAAE
jgi:DNA-binding MarR family transcriptional regulator